MTDPISHWVNIIQCRMSSLIDIHPMVYETAIPKSSYSHLADFNIKYAISAVHHGILSIVKGILSKSTTLRRLADKKSSSAITMSEAKVVYAYNRKSIMREPVGSSEILPMYAKTMSLLDKKIELQQHEDQSSNVKDRLQILLMKGYVLHLCQIMNCVLLVTGLLRGVKTKVPLEQPAVSTL